MHKNKFWIFYSVLEIYLGYVSVEYDFKFNVHVGYWEDNDLIKILFRLFLYVLYLYTGNVWIYKFIFFLVRFIEWSG